MLTELPEDRGHSRAQVRQVIGTQIPMTGNPNDER